MTKLIDSLIVGAGISGLSVAYSLQKLGQKSPVNILVTDSQNRVGGNIVTNTANGFLWEEGPNSFAPTPELLKLAVDVGLGSELLFADRRLPRYVFWDHQLQAVPMSPPAIISTKLLSDYGKLRAFLGMIGFVVPALGATLSHQGGEETVSQFFQRHLGTEVMTRLIEPFVSGVYAGDPQKLSATAAFRMAKLADNYGGLLAGLIHSRKGKPKPVVDPSVPQVKAGELGSFQRGLESLPKAIASQLSDKIKLQWQLISLAKTESGTYLATYQTPSGSEKVEAKTVVLTTPAYVAGTLLQPLSATVATALKEFYYPPVAAVVLAYPLTALRQKLVGFGNLIPRGQGIKTLGTIWTSSLFPHRAPQGWQSVTNYIGGATYPEIANFSPDEIVSQVHQDLQKTLLNADVKPQVLAVRLWQRAIPQYNLGHHDRLDRINHGLQSLPGLFLSSNYGEGVALGECVKRGMEKAIEIDRYLH